MLSYISLHKENWQDHSYVALCSVADHAMFRMLTQNNDTEEYTASGLHIKEKSMSHDINQTQFETRKVSGCNVRVFFTEKENPEIKRYVLSNLLEAFEKRNNLCGDCLI